MPGRGPEPDPRIFRYPLAALGVAPEDAVFVDDRTEFLDGAGRLGIGTLQILHTESLSPPPHRSHHEVTTTLAGIVDRFALAGGSVRQQEETGG